MNPTLELGGVDVVIGRLQRLAQRVPQQVGAAMRAEAEIEMTEAKQRTPVDTGALRASGHVEGPNFRGRDIEVIYGFGGPSVNYAIRVHEDLEVYHRTGQAKYLESVLLESEPYMAGRIADRIQFGRELPTL